MEQMPYYLRILEGEYPYYRRKFLEYFAELDHMRKQISKKYAKRENEDNRKPRINYVSKVYSKKKSREDYKIIVNSKISKLYVKKKNPTGYKTAIQKKKQIEDYVLLGTHYLKLEFIKNWGDFRVTKRIVNKLNIRGIKFRLRKLVHNYTDGYYFYWCIVCSELEVRCSKVFMYEGSYPDEIEFDEEFVFKDIFNDMLVTIELHYFFLPYEDDIHADMVQISEYINGGFKHLQLPYLPYTTVGQFHILTSINRNRLLNENDDLDPDIPVIARMVNHSVIFTYVDPAITPRYKI